MDKLIENWTVLAMLKRRLMDAESLGGQCEIDAEELSAAIKAVERAVEALTRIADIPITDIYARPERPYSIASETLSLINGVESPAD